jgi:hypothetical protein
VPTCCAAAEKNERSFAQARELLERCAEIYRSRYPDASGRINVLLYLADVARWPGGPRGQLAWPPTRPWMQPRGRAPAALLQLANAHSARGAIR